MTNRSLQEKSAARLVAAQLLYKAAITQEALKPESLMAEYAAHLEEEAREASPNATHLKKLLEGVAAHHDTLVLLVEQCLTEKWKRERMSPLMIAILTLALFELAELSDIKTPIIINEYVTLTGRFFDERETGFVNAALHAMAKKLRASE